MKRNVYDEKQQNYRVQFACQTMLNYANSKYATASPNPSRKFDTCFEMGDAEAVAAKVYRRALKNPKLTNVLHKFINVEMAKKSYEEYGVF